MKASNELKKQLLDVLKTNEEYMFHSRYLANETGKSLAQVKTALRSLKKEGLVYTGTIFSEEDGLLRGTGWGVVYQVAKSSLPTKKTLLIDFDGVIHKYSKGWHDGTAYDVPMPGAKEALAELARKYEVIIFSTRNWWEIKDWLFKYGFPNYPATSTKKPAIALIDDRAIHFTGWEKALDEFQERYEK